ncbi:hypothetical protein I592_00586 [Enterococcus gilvus ATCC BAA-350]|uniref:Uncharacterized protein n=1 Tax=Enterococcus gilvus ATCC BAA-350 TaxID=1158614 RepID=R2XF20_9ENTE|nr:hypothetical protein UKC_03376 [Enterococcus gilvus ATCC BAA-350]EOW81301.1 hypothetical protein I592_00586 [Enterococcus gilvus ATCC BAA-350]
MSSSDIITLSTIVFGLASIIINVYLIVRDIFF